MTLFHIGTTKPTWWDYAVSTSESIRGSWPNLTYHVDYNFQWYAKTNGVSISYNNSYYTFHNQQQKVATNIRLNAGQYSGPICSGAIDFGWGNARSVAHSPGTSVSSYASGSGVVNLPALTIPEGTLSSSLASYTHDSATINISYTSPYNYWIVKIYNTTGILYKDNCVNGENTITGLAPGTNYTFNVELWGRDGGVVIRRQITLRTNGFSYLGGNVSNTLETPIVFRAYTYSDSFMTRVAINYGGSNLCTIDQYSSGRVFDFNYSLASAQLQRVYASIPNSLSCNGTITLTTYIGGVASGSTSYTITFNVNQAVSAPGIYSYAYVDTVQKAIDKTGDSTHVLQNVSILQIKDISSITRNSSTVSKYRLTVDGATFESSSTTIATNKIITSNSGIDLTIIDSRGLQSSKHINFAKYIGYSKPIINECVLSRVNDVEESTYLKVKATFDRLTEKNIAVEIKYRYRATGSSAWSSYTSKIGTIKDSVITYDNIIGIFDTGKSYDFEVVVADYFYSVQFNQVLLKGQFELFIGDGVVEVNGGLKHNDSDVLDVSNGVTKDTGVVAHMTAKNGYLGFDSATGDWLRTPASGLLPNVPGVASHIGTSSWRFLAGYFNDLSVSNSIGCHSLSASDTDFYGNVQNSSWWRSNGNVGWFNNTYGGGIYMKDSNYVRVYNGKNFWCDGTVASGEFYNVGRNQYCITGGNIFQLNDNNGTYLHVSRNSGNAKGVTWWDSDSTLKEHIRDSEVNHALSKIVEIKHVAFDWLEEKREKVQLGYVADDIEKILPCLVFDVEQGEDENGDKKKPIKHINHTTLIPLITMGMQELVQENKYLWEFNNAVVEEVCTLKNRLDRLEKLLG